jgi:hypothetical protein
MLSSCSDTSKENPQMAELTQDQTTLYGNQDFIFPPFSEEAYAKVMEWSVFEEFYSELKTLNGHTTGMLQSKTERLLIYADSLTKKLPDDLSSNSIISRMIVVKTRINLLAQEVNAAKVDSVRLQNYMNETNNAIKNLIIQINEKIEKDEIDLLHKDSENIELAKKKRFLDSVYLAQRRDQNN